MLGLLGGDNFIGLPNLMRPASASAGAMVGITHLLPKCNLLAAEDKDPQLWHLSNATRLREASSTIREYLESRYLKYLNVERTGKMYGTIADKSDDDEDGTEPRGNYQPGVWSRRSHPSSPVPAAAGRILAPKKAKKHTKTLIKSKLNQN